MCIMTFDSRDFSNICWVSSSSNNYCPVYKEYSKEKFDDSYVRLYNFIISLILTFVFARSGSGLGGIVLTVINAILISVASAGTYEIVSDPKAEKVKMSKG